MIEVIAGPTLCGPAGAFGALQSLRPAYTTSAGKAYVGDALDVLARLPSSSVDLIVTSPPYALNKKKAYGNEDASTWISWFHPFLVEMYRVLTDTGTLALNVGGAWKRGAPVRSLVHLEVALDATRNVGFHLAQEFFLYNPATIPGPTEWVNVRRCRVKCAVDPVYALTKTTSPDWDNRRVLKPYTAAMRKMMETGVPIGNSPSGHTKRDGWARDNGGAIPDNLLSLSNTESMSTWVKACKTANLPVHPARFPRGLPEFFVKLCTVEGGLVLDPFAGSNTTGWVAEGLSRRWISVEMDADYVRGSALRFSEAERAP